MVQAARRLLDLDADPSVIDAALADDPVMRPLVRAVPGMRVPGSSDGFELAVRAIVGQQVSVGGARTTLGRIAERFGEPLATPVRSIVRLFPTAERLADAPRDSFGMPGARAYAIVAVAGAVASGELELSGAAGLAPTLEALRAIPGVGEWTTAYVAMRALRDRRRVPGRRSWRATCDSRPWVCPTTFARYGAMRNDGDRGVRTPRCTSGSSSADLEKRKPSRGGGA